MSASTSTAIRGPLAHARLTDLGLAEADLRDAALEGYTQAAGCTNNDPSNLPGTIAWGKGTGRLRDLLAPAGWRSDRTTNFETTVHPTGAHCVALAAGTRETGRDDGGLPRTRTRRGPATKRAVKRNAQLQLGQGTDVFAGTGAAEPLSGRDAVTWLLLHHYDADSGEIRLELSCPLEMSGKQITRWRERIILDPVPFASDVEIDIDEPIDDVIDIDVQWKAD